MSDLDDLVMTCQEYCLGFSLKTHTGIFVSVVITTGERAGNLEEWRFQMRGPINIVVEHALKWVHTTVDTACLRVRK